MFGAEVRNHVAIRHANELYVAQWARIVVYVVHHLSEC